MISGWMSLKTYMMIIRGLHTESKTFDFNICASWTEHLSSSEISIKAADIVMYDRHIDKINA